MLCVVCVVCCLGRRIISLFAATLSVMMALWRWRRWGLGSGGCGRPCDHQRQAPAVHCVRERGGAPFQFIDRVVDFSVVFQRRVPTVQTVQKTGEFPQVLFLDRLMTPVVMQRQVLGVDSAENCGSSTVAVLGQGCGHACCCAQLLKPVEIPQVQFLDRLRYVVVLNC